MKIPTGAYLALGFILLLITIWGGVWFVGQFVRSSTQTSTSGSGLFGSLFPFSNTVSTILGGGNSDTQATNTGAAPVLRKVSDEPVAGARFAVGLSGAPSIRYVERNTGHYYETPVDAVTTVRITNTTIPAVHDALWVTASSSLMRFLTETGTIENFVGVFGSSTPDQELQGVFLKNYDRVALGAGNTILGLTKTPTGSTLETVLLDGTKPKQLIVSPLSYWTPLAAGNKYFIASAPSAGTPGALYDISNGTMQKVVGELSGLQVVLNADASEALLTTGAQNAVQLYALTLKTGAVVQLPRGTLGAKCAWVPKQPHKALCALPQALPQAAYPDDWLLGRVHTADDLWLIDTETAALTDVMQLEAVAGIPIDVADVHVSDDGRYAIFINRNDQTLWSALIQPLQ